MWKIVRLESKVTISPVHLHSGFQQEIIKELENNNNHHGGKIVKDIISLDNVGDAEIDCFSYTMGLPTFPVSFTAKICAPVEEMQIPAKVTGIRGVDVALSNGPVVITCIMIDSDKKVFRIANEKLIVNSTKEPVVRGDIVLVTLTNVTEKPGRRTIIAQGFLSGVATEGDMNAYHENNQISGIDKLFDEDELFI